MHMPGRGQVCVKDRGGGVAGKENSRIEVECSGLVVGWIRRCAGVSEGEMYRWMCVCAYGIWHGVGILCLQVVSGCE